MIFDTWIPDAREKYMKAIDLIENKRKGDPITNPYKSCYEGRDILQSLLQECQDYEGNEEGKKVVNLIEAVLHYEIGTVSIDVEENSVGDKHLETARKKLSDHFERNPHLTLLYLKTLNAISLLKCTFGKYDEALSDLKEAENLYKEWSKIRSEDSNFLTLNLLSALSTDPFSGNTHSSDDVVKSVEKEFTQTVYYLAQVYEKMGESHLSAEYCTQTLIRQLRSDDYNVGEWALNAAIISQYYACKNMFTTARHFLAASEFQMKKAQDGDSESLERKRADLDRIIVKYCMMLLEKDEQELNNENPVVRLISDPEVDRIEEVLPMSRADSYESALQIFLLANKRLATAIKFLTLNEHASDHADCILDQSKLYRLLIQFQTEAGKICKMHKRRIDLLQKLLSEMNPQYFLAHTRKIAFELAETFSEMVHHKSTDPDNTDKEGKLMPSAAVKINLLISQSIRYYTQFIDSFRDKNKQLPHKLDDDNVRPVLIAWFSIGRLHTKKISSYQNEQLQLWTECEQCYKNVIDYIERNPEHENLVSNELNIIREMLTLIPEKKKLILTSTIY